MDRYEARLKEAAAYIENKVEKLPKIALILGSGLGPLADEIDGQVLAYEDIPNFPISTVAGHEGKLVIGKFEDQDVMAMQGRFHFYEGYDIKETVFPVRVMKLLGVETIIVTNAAGGVNLDYQPGDLMLIADHINLTGQNPLIGANLDDFGLRFPDMSDAYSRDLRALAKKVADQSGIQVREGVYAGMTGPSYETPAEIRMLRIMGADAIGMSTVAEAITAAHSGIRVLGISCISNMAAGILDQPLTHAEVMETTEKVKKEFASLVRNIIQAL